MECIRNWPFGLFYILAELWGSVVLSLLFWAFANDTTKVSEAKRFYALFGLGANLALVVSGPTIVMISNIRDRLPADVDAWQVSLNYFMTSRCRGWFRRCCCLLVHQSIHSDRFPFL